MWDPQKAIRLLLRGICEEHIRIIIRIYSPTPQEAVDLKKIVACVTDKHFVLCCSWGFYFPTEKFLQPLTPDKYLRKPLGYSYSLVRKAISPLSDAIAAKRAEVPEFESISGHKLFENTRGSKRKFTEYMEAEYGAGPRIDRGRVEYDETFGTN